MLSARLVGERRGRGVGDGSGRARGGGLFLSPTLSHSIPLYPTLSHSIPLTPAQIQSVASSLRHRPCVYLCGGLEDRYRVPPSECEREPAHPQALSHYRLPLLSHAFLPLVSHSALILPLNTHTSTKCERQIPPPTPKISPPPPPQQQPHPHDSAPSMKSPRPRW